MASGDAGEILRKIAELSSKLDRIERALRDVSDKVDRINRNTR